MMRKLLVTITIFMLTAVGSVYAQHFNEWDDPAVFQLNRERAHAIALPQQTVASRGESDYWDSPYVMSLNGTWKFYWAPNPDKAPTGFIGTPHFSDGSD